MAWAPKLMRRVKGVVGAVRAEDVSSSSMAFSSIESELVDTLDRRSPKGVLGTPLGDVPDNPIVEMERRRRWSIGKAGVVVDVEPLLWKRFVRGLLTELRRWRGISAEGTPLLELSLDMMIFRGTRAR